MFNTEPANRHLEKKTFRQFVICFLIIIVINLLIYYTDKKHD